jgi:hypothetical protein
MRFNFRAPLALSARMAPASSSEQLKPRMSLVSKLKSRKPTETLLLMTRAMTVA